MAIKLEDLIPGGKGDNAPKRGVNVYELQMGIKVEMEHTNSKAKAEEIARDHLAEDPEYYTKLDKAGLADELHESKVGDFYIQIGEAIEEIDSAYDKLSNLLNKIPRPEKGPIPILINLKKIESGIYDLKKTFGESYDFQDKKVMVQLTKLNVDGLIDYLDSLATFKQYRNQNASYDDEFYMDIPYDLFVKYGLTKKVIDKINDNTHDYQGYVEIDNKKKTVSISGGDA